MKKRMFVTANLHGRLKEFKCLLKHVEFDFSRDKLFVLGGNLNKGSYQLELIDYLIELKEQYPNSIYLIYGEIEKLYISALVNKDFTAEQKIVSENNVYYNYLDNPELRNKHISFLVGMPDNYNVNKVYFSNEKRLVKDYFCIYPITEPNTDFIKEEKSMGISFVDRVGLLDITNRTCYRI